MKQQFVHKTQLEVSETSDFEKVPSFWQLLVALKEYLHGHYREEITLKRTYSSTEEITFTWFDVGLVLLLALIWTYLRMMLDCYIFKPIGSYYNLTKKNQKKLPESAWKLLFHIFIWGFNFYILILSGKYQFFQKPSTAWKDWDLLHPIPTDIYILHVWSVSYYIHSLYGAIFMDIWRKDSTIMLVHHIVGVILISTFYKARCHYLGALTLFHHDVSDIFLYFRKLNLYFMERDGKIIYIHKILTNISFLCFTLTWFLMTMYWHPLKVLYNFLNNCPHDVTMNSILWFAQSLHVYWSYHILRILYEIIIEGFSFNDDRDV